MFWTLVNVFLSVENCSNLKLGGGKISFKTLVPVFIVNSSGEAFNKIFHRLCVLCEVCCLELETFAKSGVSQTLGPSPVKTLVLPL